MLATITALSFLATVQASLSNNTPRDVCKPCNPQGATNTKAPTIGPDLKTLYMDVLGSVKNIHFRKRTTPPSPFSPRANAFCCHEFLDCVTIQNLNIAMCYDKFTTNYQLPDGSYGSLTTGDFTSGGSKANLLSGEYVKEGGGGSGNIYANDGAAKPNTKTLSIPPQFTGTGVGSAIPASEIGSLITTASMGSSVAVKTTAPATTTAAGSTPTGGAPTSSRQTGSSGTAAGASSSQAGAVGAFVVDWTKSFSVSVITGLMYLLYMF